MAYVMRWLSKSFHASASLFHIACVFCDAARQTNQSPLFVCLRCQKKLLNWVWHCKRCGKRTPVNQCVCSACLLLPEDDTHIIVAYEYSHIKPLIHRMKYQSHIQSASLLADLLCQRMQNLPLNAFGGVQAIVPIPATNWHVWQRKFDQSVEMARRMGRRLQLPYHACLRNKGVGGYNRLSKEQRVLQERFTTRRFTSMPAYSHVALLDDVMTTGASLQQARDVLLKNKWAKKVSFWLVSRVF